MRVLCAAVMIHWMWEQLGRAGWKESEVGGLELFIFLGTTSGRLVSRALEVSRPGMVHTLVRICLLEPMLRASRGAYRTIRYVYPGFIVMLKSYSHSCSSRGVPYYTTSLHQLIPPPIKRVTTLVSYLGTKVRRGYDNLSKFYYLNTVIPMAAKRVDTKIVAGYGILQSAKSGSQQPRRTRPRRCLCMRCSSTVLAWPCCYLALRPMALIKFVPSIGVHT